MTLLTSIKKVNLQVEEFEKIIHDIVFCGDEKLKDSWADHINKLMKEAKKLRDRSIYLELRSGVPNKILSIRYNLTTARISQIKAEQQKLEISKASKHP